MVWERLSLGYTVHVFIKDFGGCRVFEAEKLWDKWYNVTNTNSHKVQKHNFWPGTKSFNVFPDKHDFLFLKPD